MSSPYKGRVLGLDSIRFLCALWVAFSHGAYPKLTADFDTSAPVQWLINGVYTSLFCGPAAVIIFFIVSGFCIHFPYQSKWHKKDLPAFLLSRLIRICGPILIASLINLILKLEISIFYQLVGWSIVCEIAYYLLYPFLRQLIQTTTGWNRLLIISFIPTLSLFFYFPLDLVNYPGVGTIYVILLGFPCWLTGVVLTYKFSNALDPSRLKLITYRSIIFGTAFITHVLALQEILGHPFTLNFFALIAFFWLREEIAYFKKHSPLTFLENAGKASYSLYLMHGVANHLLEKLPTTHLSSIIVQLIQWLILAGLTIAFFFLVEKPFHLLSKSSKTYLTKRN